MLRARSRVLRSSNKPLLGVFQLKNYGKGRKSEPPSPRYSSLGTVTNVEEWCFDELHEGPPFRTGGPFLMTRKVYPNNVTQGSIFIKGVRINDVPDGQWSPTLGFVLDIGSDWRWTYQGGFGDPQIPGDLPALPAMSFTPSGISSGFHPVANPDDLGSLGNRGWAKLRPDPARAGAMQFVIELRDAPRMLQTSARGFSRLWRSLGGKPSGDTALPKEIGDQYLNQAFGWKPFLGDLGDMFSTVKDFQKFSERAMALNGKYVKRRFAESIIVDEQLVHQSNSPSDSTYCAPNLHSLNGYTNLRDPLGTHGNGRPENRTVHRVTTAEIWYEGKFRSYRPEFDRGLQSGYPALDKARQMASLQGLRVNATTLYNVTPWTWLVDWFVNVGDAVQRYEDMITDTVAAEYFYLMRRIQSHYVITITKQTYNGPIQLSWKMGVTTKRRAVGASAFGFSAAPGGLSGSQLAILGALGMSKMS